MAACTLAPQPSAWQPSYWAPCWPYWADAAWAGWAWGLSPYAACTACAETAPWRTIRHSGARTSITVEGTPAKKIKKAANELAAVAINAVGGYSRVKIAKLQEQIQFDNQSIARNNDRFSLAQAQQKAILANNSLSATERLLLLANINTTLVTVEQRLGQLETDRLSAQQFLSLAESVERPQIRSQAVAVKTAGANSRTGAAVGGLIGLIVGILAALLWDPIAARRPQV